MDPTVLDQLSLSSASSSPNLRIRTSQSDALNHMLSITDKVSEAQPGQPLHLRSHLLTSRALVSRRKMFSLRRHGGVFQEGGYKRTAQVSQLLSLAIGRMQRRVKLLSCIQDADHRRSRVVHWVKIGGRIMDEIPSKTLLCKQGEVSRSQTPKYSDLCSMEFDPLEAAIWLVV